MQLFGNAGRSPGAGPGPVVFSMIPTVIELPSVKALQSYAFEDALVQIRHRVLLKAYIVDAEALRSANAPAISLPWGTPIKQDAEKYLLGQIKMDKQPKKFGKVVDDLKTKEEVLLQLEKKCSTNSWSPLTVCFDEKKTS